MTTTFRGSVAPGEKVADEIDRTALDEAIAKVAARASTWAATGPKARAALLDQVLKDTEAAAEGWLADACQAKGLDPTSSEAGEELFAGVITFVRLARFLRDSLIDIDKGGRPRYPGPMHKRDTGRTTVGVFPTSVAERVIFAGTKAEVWMEPGTELTQAAAYRHPKAEPGVSLVLGAGNVAGLGPRDVLQKLFVEGKVVVLKANPVNDYLVPHWERAMRALIDAGLLVIVHGGQAAGSYLTAHPGIDDIHVTGSDKTHDAIVFGTGPEGERRKAAGELLCDKPVSCELGNVSPVIIVPGPWSTSDLLYQAEHVATMLVNNAGFNCLTARVIVTHEAWPQRAAFLGALSECLAKLPARKAYYPGAESRRDAFLEAHPEAESFGKAGDGMLPWTLIRNVDAGKTDDICFNVEAFCGLFAETALASSSPSAFLDEAVDFCNDVVWGTLSATVIVHPKADVDEALAKAVANLRYGAIGVNIWHATAFALATTTWGAYPGHPVTDIQSGKGAVGNAFMFDHPEKSVVYGPWRSKPKPPWFATHERSLPVMRRLLAFEAAPSSVRLARILAAAIR